METRELKNAGESYRNYKGKLIGAKKMLNNPCKENTCKNKCYLISEKDRCEFFNIFWKLKDSLVQKRYLNDCVEVCQVKRHRKSKGVRQRNVTHKYFVIQDKLKRQVCLQFLLNTFNITH